MTETEVCDYLRLPFEGDNSELAYAAHGVDTADSGEAMGLAIVDRIKDRIGGIKDIVTVEVSLFAAKLAFDFAVSRLPFELPAELKAKLWTLCETGIRAIYMGS